MAPPNRPSTGAAQSTRAALAGASAALLLGAAGTWLLRRHRSLAVQLDRRAREEAALRRVARALSGTVTVREVMQLVAEGAVQTTRAFGAYVEQVVSPTGEVEIVAAAGEGTPPLGTRVPYPGSLTEETIEEGEPALMTEVGTIGERMAPYLTESCRGCSGLVVPLLSAREVLGTLVLLRSPAQEQFSSAEVGRVRILGDLASVALRRAVLTEQLRRSVERFRFLHEANPTMYFTVGTDGVVVSVNRYGAEYLGYTVEELEGRPIAEVFYAPDREEARRRIAECLEKPGAVCRWELRKVRRQDGSVIWVREIARAAHRQDGRLVVLIVCEDITDKKRAEQERERLLGSERDAREEAERRARQEAALREATQGLADALASDDVVRRIAECALQATEARGAFVEWIDVSGSELVVRATAGEGVPAPGQRMPYAGSLTGLVVERGEPLVVWDLNAAERPLPADLIASCAHCSAIVVPLVSSSQPIGSLFLLRDREHPFRPDEIARARTFGDLAALAFQKVKLLEQAEQRREELERVMESKARLIRGFSHDLKNPLGAADGHAALMEDGILGELAPRQEESVRRIRASIGSALALIQDLVELARAEAGQLEIERQPTDVREAVRGLVEEYRAQAEGAGLSLEEVLPDDLPVVESDPVRVRQVLGNLLSNAVKYTPAGGRVVVCTTVRESEAGECVAVDVEDTGPGIPREKQVLLFKEFTRLDPGAKGGAGIGLAISQRIARLLGGEITVRSDAGEGSTFTLWLPLEGEPPAAEP